MCPRVAKTKSSREFLSSDLGGSFNHRSERIAQLTGVFPVGVIDAPKLISRLRRQNWCRVHAAIEHDAASRQVRIAHFLAASIDDGALRGTIGGNVSSTKWMPLAPNGGNKYARRSQQGICFVRSCWARRSQTDRRRFRGSGTHSEETE